MDEKEKILRYIQELATRIHSLKARVERLKGSTLKTVSGDPATFDDAIPYIALKQLKVNIDPVQSGSGDPSPTNIRPISGHIEVNVRVYNDSVDNQYNIHLGQTVYGGVLDVVSGELVVDRVMVDLGSLNWFEYGSTESYSRYASISLDNLAKNNADGLCSMYPKALSSSSYNANSFYISSGSGRLSVFTTKEEYASAADFKTAMNGVQLVYELADPQIYQLTPTIVRTILGENNIQADTGSVEVIYRAKAA